MANVIILIINLDKSNYCKNHFPLLNSWSMSTEQVGTISKEKCSRFQVEIVTVDQLREGVWHSFFQQDNLSVPLNFRAVTCMIFDVQKLFALQSVRQYLLIYLHENPLKLNTQSRFDKIFIFQVIHFE